MKKANLIAHVLMCLAIIIACTYWFDTMSESSNVMLISTIAAFIASLQYRELLPVLAIMLLNQLIAESGFLTLLQQFHNLLHLQLSLHIYGF